LDLNKVKELLSFAGLKNEFNESRIQIHNAGKNLNLEWTEEKTDKFNRIAGDIMRHFGYTLK